MRWQALRRAGAFRSEREAFLPARGALRSKKEAFPAVARLLDKQDRGEPLTEEELAEAEGLVDLAELVSVLRLRARSSGEG